MSKTFREEEYIGFVWKKLRAHAEDAANREPLMKPLMDEAILKHKEFRESLSYRLVTKLGGEIITSDHWLKIFQEAYLLNNDLRVPNLEHAACLDLEAIKERDPACDSILTAFMYFKGYKALQIYRVSHCLWESGRKELAALMQSRCSEVFAVDIHPAASIGTGLMMDHATGVVIGETAVIGDNCSFLHGVTLGSNGKEWGDRHPKLGNNVVVGCGASIIGNITIGDDSKIGSGSIVLKPVPSGVTAVGNPARVIVRSKNLLANASEADSTSRNPESLHNPSVQQDIKHDRQSNGDAGSKHDESANARLGTKIKEFHFSESNGTAKSSTVVTDILSHDMTHKNNFTKDTGHQTFQRIL